jgi:hypothetical protein
MRSPRPRRGRVRLPEGEVDRGAFCRGARRGSGGRQKSFASEGMIAGQGSGEAAALTSAVGRSTHDVMKGKGRAGGPLPAVAAWRRGRQDAALQGEKTQTRMFAFFASARPLTMGKGLPSPFEPLRDGFGTGTERSGVERANPSYLLLQRGKPGGEGEGLYMPP